ncbi:hypothetical protein [Limisalsivibrio acetivorans]|uniref:hypothetical protein n=1 Tax=Limisalsivibrio acetivorans TaxID=1304888 RepID=UPI0003B2FAEC|nr:hypothetical protein [Limisalsivibrio acetivorans]
MMMNFPDYIDGKPEGGIKLNCIQFMQPEVSEAKALPSVTAMEFPWMEDSINILR